MVTTLDKLWENYGITEERIDQISSDMRRLYKSADNLYTAIRYIDINYQKPIEKIIAAYFFAYLDGFTDATEKLFGNIDNAVIQFSDGNGIIIRTLHIGGKNNEKH